MFDLFENVIDLAQSKKTGGGSAELPFGETTTVKEVLAECQPGANNEGLFLIMSPVDGVEIGETYTVNWNGVDYECDAYEYNEDGVISACLGKADIDTGTGDPFVITIIPAELVESVGFGAMAMPLDGSTTLTISIRQEVTEVKKISGKYVEGMGYSEVAKTVIFSGDVEMPLIMTDPTYVAGGEVEVNLATVPEEVTVTVGGVSTVISSENQRFAYSGRNIALYLDADKVTFDCESFEGGFTIEDITIEAVTETIHPLDEKLIVLTSPNGTKYNLSVADDGTLSAVAAT